MHQRSTFESKDSRYAGKTTNNSHRKIDGDKIRLHSVKLNKMLQNALGEVFADLSNKSPELQDEFLYNADTQKALVKGGEQLIGALNFFVSSVNTLCNKTMEDSIDTVRRYESARLDHINRNLATLCL